MNLRMRLFLILLLVLLVFTAYVVSLKSESEQEDADTSVETETTYVPIRIYSPMYELVPITEETTSEEVYVEETTEEEIYVEEVPEEVAEEVVEIVEETEEEVELVTIEVMSIQANGCSKVPMYNYTEEELDLLSRLIFSEGGIESYETQLMIGSVVMNRVNDPAFPNTIGEVIYQERQFSVTRIKKDGILMIDHPADEEAKKAALEVLTYGSVLPHEVQVFFQKDCKESWVNSREPYGTFDTTTFAYIYERVGE